MSAAAAASAAATMAVTSGGSLSAASPSAVASVGSPAPGPPVAVSGGSSDHSLLPDLEIFNLSKSKDEAEKSADALAGNSNVDSVVVEDNAPLFYSPGKRGFYSPIQGKATAERLNAFRNVGRLMGLCLLQNELCPVFLNRHVIKFMLGRKVRFHDLAFFDPVIYESLRQLVVDAENKVSLGLFTE